MCASQESFDIARSKAFDKHFGKLDHQVRKRVMVAIVKIAELPDPTLRLKPLRGALTGFWRLRVDDYRVILKVEHSRLVIVAIDVGHRREIYRQ